ncbi:MAG: DUF5317 domain-containing protein [Bacillota bacterium]|jgi:hypothetical protein|nr:DUF5317 domain-containing protein [Bacillota bacterium]
MLFEIILFSILSILMAIIVLLCKKRSLDLKSYNLNIRGYKVLILAAVIKITAEFLFKKFTGLTLLRILSLNWVIYFSLIYVSLLNIRNPFMMLFFSGALLNFAAIAANGFKMPVYVPDLLTDVEAKKMFLLSGKDLVHTLLTEETKLKFLCDIITLHPPYPFPKSISVGDVFLLAGVFAFWQDLFYEGSRASEH